MILSKDVTNAVITIDSKGVMILSQSSKILLFLHTKGFLHDDLNGNNVLLDGATHKPVLINFGKNNQGKDFNTKSWH